MNEPKYFLDFFNLKFAIQFAKMFLFIILASLVYLVYAEWVRMQDTQMAMAMFTRIAANYALTSSQDVDELTQANENEFRRNAIMYNESEYSDFLNKLNSASNDTGDRNLTYACSVLNRAYSLADASNLDNTLRYTPMSFNVPYLSYDMLIECYRDAMETMVANYNCHGSPSILLCNGNNNLKDSHGNTHALCDITTFTSYDEYGHSQPFYSYGSHGLGFNVQPMTPVLIRSIYGNEDFYNETVTKVLGSLDPTLYDDPRIIYDSFGNATNENNYVLVYNLEFNTPYYYITASRLLTFGHVTDTGETVTASNGTSNAVVNTLNGYNGLYCYSRGDNGQPATDNLIYNTSPGHQFYTFAQPRSGQLCFFVEKSSSYGNRGASTSAQFSYTYIS